MSSKIKNKSQARAKKRREKRKKAKKAVWLRSLIFKKFEPLQHRPEYKPKPIFEFDYYEYILAEEKLRKIRCRAILFRNFK